MSNASDFIIENGVLKKYVGPGGDVPVPDGVTEIGMMAFWNNGEVKKVYLPDSMIRIGNGAFYGCGSLMRVDIPGSVTEIGREAFSCCEALTGLELPNSVKRIGFGAFYGCKRLSRIHIPDSVSELESEAFRNCPGLADDKGFVIVQDTLYGYYGPGGDVAVPDGVRRISNGAFCACGSITSLVLPDTVTELGDHLFQDCASLADENGFVILRDVLYGYYGTDPNVVVPEGVTKIGRNAFFKDVNIQRVKLPKGVTQIGNAAFYGCMNLTGLQLPEEVSVIGHSAFEDCYRLAAVTLPAGVIAIGNKAFRQCARLKEVTLPQSMTYFGAEAFLWCGGLTKVVISDGVTAIGNKAFLGCQSLTEVMFPESVVKIGAEAFSGCTHLSEITIPKAVTAIGNEAFKDCGSLANVVISGNVTELGSNIFYGISDQAVIHAPCIPFDYFQTAEEKRAAACGFLNQPDLYQNTTGGDAYKKYVIAQRKRLLPYVFQKDLVQALAFFGANKKITVSNFETEYLESAGKSNALGCVAYLMDWRNANITDKALAKKDERELTKDPFNVSDMKKLWSYETMEDGTLMLTSYKGMETEVRVPHRIGKTPVTRLDDCVFATMTKNASYKPKKLIAALQAIQSVSIPDSVTSIGDMAFFECKGLKNVEIPDSVTSIGSKAFFGCESLTDGNGLVIVRNVLYGYYGSGGDVTIPPCVTEIVDAAFATRSNITGVEIPDSVTSIGKSAFMNCSCLKNVRISKNVTCISDGVFSGCSSLTSVEIPEGVNSIGVFAFSDCRKLQNILLPGSITNLGSGAFRKCDKLADDQGFVIVKDVLYSYCGSGGDIKIPEGVRIIDNEAFYLRKKITGVVIPEGVTRIGYNAFSGCTNLTYVVIPGSVTDISFSVFGYANQPQIRAPRGSYAEAYAKEGHYPFVAE